MANLLNELTEMLAPQLAPVLHQETGIEERRVPEMLQEVVPTVLSGLQKQGQSGNLEHLLQAVGRFGGEAALDDVPSLAKSVLSQPEPDASLTSLLGDSGKVASSTLASKFGLDQGLSSKLVTLLVPLVVGALLKKSGSGGLQGLASLLTGGDSGGLLGGLAGALGDKLLGGDDDKSSNNSGPDLGGLMGSLFGGR